MNRFHLEQHAAPHAGLVRFGPLHERRGKRALRSLPTRGAHKEDCCPAAFAILAGVHLS